MFGFYRILLSFSVAAAHLGNLPTGAHYAVFGFFILSGYLVTLILHQNYTYSPSGRARYLLNRALRIYPPYWLAAGISLLLMAWLGAGFATAYHPLMHPPATAQAVLENLFLVFGYMSDPRLIPPAWALTVELFFYTGIGLGLSRTKTRTVWWFSLSLAYTVLINILHVSFDAKYFLIPAASLPFSTGALLYHFRTEIPRRWPLLAAPATPAVLLGLLILDIAAGVHPRFYFSWGFYISYVLNAALVASLLDRKSLPFLSRKWDAVLGEMSYPIYIVHYQAGLLLMGLGWTGARRGSPLFFLMALPIVVIMAWMLTTLVERPMEILRRRIKQKPQPA